MARDAPRRVAPTPHPCARAGADLKAVLAEAQLLAVHRALDMHASGSGSRSRSRGGAGLGGGAPEGVVADEEEEEGGAEESVQVGCCKSSLLFGAVPDCWPNYIYSHTSAILVAFPCVALAKPSPLFPGLASPSVFPLLPIFAPAGHDHGRRAPGAAGGAAIRARGGAAYLDCSSHGCGGAACGGRGGQSCCRRDKTRHNGMRGEGCTPPTLRPPRGSFLAGGIANLPFAASYRTIRIHEYSIHSRHITQTKVVNSALAASTAPPVEMAASSTSWLSRPSITTPSARG